MISAPVALLLLSATVPLTISSIVVHYTSSGGVCSGVCGYHGYGYTWCKKSDGSWDYCSLEPGIEVTGKRCSTPCDFWGGSYRYCYLQNGNWNYCGLLGQRELDQYSQNNKICINSCRVTKDSFQCMTVKDNERCSPFRDVTPKGFPCHNNYRCAKYGHDVHRCHIGYGEDEGDYCGQKSLDMCVWVKGSSATEICTLPRSQTEGPIIFRRQLRNLRYPFSNTQFQKAVFLIAKINSITNFPDYGHPASAYLYKRGSVFCGGINYTNVELKMSCFNQTSVSVAHVLFPENLSSVEILRLAFYTSLHSSFYLPAYTIVVSVGKPMQCSTEPMI